MSPNRFVQDIQIHTSFLEPPSRTDAELIESLARRRLQLRCHIAERLDPRAPEIRLTAAWLMRSYPVLAVQAPVMATQEGKIEYPGDPLCLYSALSVAMAQAVQARRAALSEQDPYNDLCPRWGHYPSREYRRRVDDVPSRDYAQADPNTDQTVYAPDVWNAQTRAFFAEQVLRAVQPRVVLISAVSPAHRYAVDMARTVRRVLPEALIVLGGPHLDETLRYDAASGTLKLEYSGTLSALADGRIAPVFDFLVGGDGYYALDALMKAISAAMHIETRQVSVAQVVEALDALAPLLGPLPGEAVIAALDCAALDSVAQDSVALDSAAQDGAAQNKAATHVFPIRGRPIDLGELPSPYRAFAIRARFPIFQAEDGSVQRTAHFMAAASCPYHCNYCSEAATVNKHVLRFTRNAEASALDRVLEYVSYGAEALFFDDSIFWAGHVRHMIEFCNLLIQAKAQALWRPPGDQAWLREEQDWQRLYDVQWGAQLTVEFLTSLQSREKALELLYAMRAAGCTYIYFGIESMSPEVMQHIHKNLARAGGLDWPEKVRVALELVKSAGLRAGASVLFGLDGETRATIDETVQGLSRLLADRLLDIASPNILTYHPATAITRAHNMQDKLDYHSLNAEIKPPYTYFEEAFPQVVSQKLCEDDVWYIYRQTRLHWSRETVIDPYAVHADVVRDVWGRPTHKPARPWRPVLIMPCPLAVVDLEPAAI